jgi:Fe-S-cluster containining protein
MAWLCVNKCGTECISEEKLIRWPPIEKKDKRIKKYKQILSKDDQCAWVWPYNTEEGGQMVYLPKGSIEKLIGKKLTWEDEPYEYK